MSTPADRAGPAQWLFAWLQYPLPHHLLSRLVHALARARLGPLKNALIRVFVRLYRVDLSEAAIVEPARYVTFNAFFTRPLRDGVRPIAPNGRLASPVDGGLHAIGELRGEQLLQAKGRHFTLSRLLADGTLVSRFRDGEFATFYLAPYDYHRIHMPLAGRLRRMIYVPGRLFSVNRTAANSIPEVFARNERLVCEFETAAGALAVVLVGALLVGSIETTWAGEVTPRSRRPAAWDYPAEGSGAVRLGKGEELGRFNLGSTVVLLLEPGRVHWNERLGCGTHVRMGAPLGTLLPAGRARTAR